MVYCINWLQILNFVKIKSEIFLQKSPKIAALNVGEPSPPKTAGSFTRLVQSVDWENVPIVNTSIKPRRGKLVRFRHPKRSRTARRSARKVTYYFKTVLIIIQGNVDKTKAKVSMETTFFTEERRKWPQLRLKVKYFLVSCWILQDV